eukprot:6184585-Pleurochrysis_carterae.AAC.1
MHDPLTVGMSDSGLHCQTLVWYYNHQMHHCHRFGNMPLRYQDLILSNLLHAYRYSFYFIFLLQNSASTAPYSKKLKCCSSNDPSISQNNLSSVTAAYYAQSTRG